MAETPVSVCAVIVTHRRSEWLKRCVRSLIVAQSGKELRLSIRILLNGEDPSSVDAIEEMQSLASREGMHFKWEKRAQATTPAAARNQLALTADSAWTLFIDDDAYVDKNYFDKFLEVQNEFPDTSVIGGPNLTPSHSTIFQRAAGIALSSRLGTFLSVARYRRKGQTRGCSEESLILCNLFVRREVTVQAPFPENFFCGEENWTLQTIAKLGLKMTHSPDLFVWHERRNNLASFVRQVHNYGIGRGKNVRLRPETFRIAHIVPSFCVFYFLIALMLRAEFWLIPLGVYIIISISAAIKSAINQKETFLVAGLATFYFPIIHFFYGVGFMQGWLKGK